MTTRWELSDKLAIARGAVRRETFGTLAYHAAFERMREITQAMTDIPTDEEFCSVDSGEHRTRLRDGRIVG
jgi:hypothetical protein